MDKESVKESRLNRNNTMHDTTRANRKVRGSSLIAHSDALDDIIVV